VPGAGKTTLARKLAKDLDLPQIGKDDMKEFLFDKMGSRDREWSRMLGKAVSQMLYPLADTILADGNNFILESAFHHEFASKDLGDIVAKRKIKCLEIYCYLDAQERKRRFIQRNESGERHLGHVDAYNYAGPNEETDQEVYAPLGLGELFKVDTTHFGEPEYEMLRRRVTAFLNE
jgi:predicted kinase